ncbi:DUF6096 family protein [Oenococcus sicerae]|uniref:DUF6096 family protein n=1 Tax=Oenococcus sicerae TaxID=2203724 RepID=UPI0039EA264D
MVKKATNTLDFGGLTLELKLTGRDILNIEKRLGKSMMSLFMSGDGSMKLPPLNEMLIVLQGANQTHGISDEAIFKAFDKYYAEGHSPMDLFSVLTDLFQESGFFGGKKADLQTASESQPTLEAVPTQPDSLL